jgi:hypothetical protein
MDIGLDQNVDTTNAVELDLLILVLPPVTHLSHVGTSSVVLLVT